MRGGVNLDGTLIFFFVGLAAGSYAVFEFVRIFFTVGEPQQFCIARSLAGLVIAVFAFGLYGFSGDEHGRDIAEGDDECSANDLQCLVDYNWVIITVECERAIERKAEYGHEWTVRNIFFRFPDHRWKDQEDGVVTLLGDKIRFKAGSGGWTHMSYQCDVIPDSGDVMQVRVKAES